MEVLFVEDVAGGLSVTLRHADGRTEQVRAGCVLGAGGALSITRTSTHGALEGAIYVGEFVAADMRTDLPIPPEEARLFLGLHGLVLLAPLPGHHWIMFVGVDEATGTPDEAQLASLVNQHLGRDAGIHDVRWTSHFRMHNRMAPRLSEGRRFLSGTRQHLLVFGQADLEPLRQRWSGLVDILYSPMSGFDADRAGVPGGGTVLVRPDGMVDFGTSGVDGASLDALDAHLASYLVSSQAAAAASDYLMPPRLCDPTTSEASQLPNSVAGRPSMRAGWSMGRRQRPYSVSGRCA